MGPDEPSSPGSLVHFFLPYIFPYYLLLDDLTIFFMLHSFLPQHVWFFPPKFLTLSMFYIFTFFHELHWLLCTQHSQYNSIPFLYQVLPLTVEIPDVTAVKIKAVTPLVTGRIFKYLPSSYFDFPLIVPICQTSQSYNESGRGPSLYRNLHTLASCLLYTSRCV